jgi:hypothetical protein
MIDKAKWIGGLAEWEDGEAVYLSVAFTWLIPQALRRALIARAFGQRVIAGGPAFFEPSMRLEIEQVAEVPTKIVTDENGRERIVGGDLAGGAVTRHNLDATIASRGCPVGCWFCNVPVMEGRKFTLLPDFIPRPILCDNNLSALPTDYQDHIIRRYQDAGVPLRDANSGFEPITFTEEVYRRWKQPITIGGGPWRFAYDETKEGSQVRQVMRMLAAEPPKRKRVYVLIGNEPFAECMARIQEVLDHGCEPHVQPVMKLTALQKMPWVRFDWTADKLRAVARWANRRYWRKTPSFADYDRHFKRNRTARERYDAQEGLFI